MHSYPLNTPKVLGLRRPGLPHLLAAETFCPALIKEARAAAAADKRAGALEEDDLETVVERMLHDSKMPSLPRKGLFGIGGARYSNYGRSGFHDDLSCSQRVNRQRCKTVLQVYALLDPLHAGYVDPETACSCIAEVKKENDALAGLLLHVLEDMLPFISPRGVIEKDVFLKTLHEWIEVDSSGSGPYYTLRLPTNPVSTAYREGLPCTNLADRDFYKGTYIPQGLDNTLRELTGGKASRAAGRKLKNADPAPNSGQYIRATVAGDLEAHIRETAMRREMKLAALKEKLSKTEMAECTFKPQTTEMPSFVTPFQSRRDILEKGKAAIEEEKTEKVKLKVERKFEPVDSEVATPSEDEPRRPERKDGKRKEEKETVSKGREGEAEKSGNQQENKDRMRKERKEGKTLPEVSQPTTFDIWVYHQGNPTTRPMDLEECLRLSPLPPVPLDGLSPDSPKYLQSSGRNRKAAGDCTDGRSDSFCPLLSGATPYDVDPRCSAFPHFTDRINQQKKHYEAPPPLTPGLPSTFKPGFFRERVKESNEERRIRLGLAKSTQPHPALADSPAEMRLLKKSLQGCTEGPGDPILWDTDAKDFSAGLRRTPKRQSFASPLHALRGKACAPFCHLH